MTKRALFLCVVLSLSITSCKKNIDSNNSSSISANTSLCFTAQEEGVTIEMTTEGELPSLNLEYSYDGLTWATFYPDNTIITLNRIGDMVYFRGDNPNGLSQGQYKFIKFTMNDKKVATYGNIMSLIDPTLKSKTIPNDWCFYKLFNKCKGLTKAPVLPAKTLKAHCYAYMFSECIGLGLATELPADTLAEYCYMGMFGECYNLTEAPVLPAMHIAKGCYQNMFAYSKLITTPELPATEMAPDCYGFMFAWCGNLKYASELPATVLAANCYDEMFYNSSLEYAPKILPATTLAEWCYKDMFWGTYIELPPELPATTLANGCYSDMFCCCSNLTVTPALPATNLAEGCYSGMFRYCSSLLEAPELPATYLRRGCYNGMFSGCNSLIVAPELPATILAERCYYHMFQNCTNLNRIKVYFDSWHGNDTYEWLDYTSPTGTFICPSELPLKYGEGYIPERWTVETF